VWFLSAVFNVYIVVCFYAVFVPMLLSDARTKKYNVLYPEISITIHSIAVAYGTAKIKNCKLL
jgi:hypothetical protein